VYGFLGSPRSGRLRNVAKEVLHRLRRENSIALIAGECFVNTNKGGHFQTISPQKRAEY
jgi:hypothetical protein